MRARLTGLMTDSRYGGVLRAKGHLRGRDKRWYQINRTRWEFSMEPTLNIRRGVLVVIGQT